MFQYFSQGNAGALEVRRRELTASLLVAAPKSFPMQIESLFRASLAHRISNHSVMKEEGEDKNLADIFGSEVRIIESMASLGWNNTKDGIGLILRPLRRAVRHSIHTIVSTVIEGAEWDDKDLYRTRVLEQCKVVSGWLKDWVPQPAEGDTAPFEWLMSDIDRLAAELFCRARIDDIFSIVAEYPDSHHACVELRELFDLLETNDSQNVEDRNENEDLYCVSLLPILADSLQAALGRRLTHPGADTSQIIQVYIHTIKVLRVLDPTDQWLLPVTNPVRSYLRGRADTVRCIITSLTTGDLYEELRRPDAKLLENVVTDSDEEDDEEQEEQLQQLLMEQQEQRAEYQQVKEERIAARSSRKIWQPPPSIYKARRSTFFDGYGRNSAEGDILAMLVSIYGSKQLFVNEYRRMLADKLLKLQTTVNSVLQKNVSLVDYYNTDKEVHTLELLKLRFGETSMRNCEVMIKDMDDSKRANAHIHEELCRARRHQESSLAENTENRPIVDAAMISHIFWPNLQQDTLKHHERIQSEVDEFSAAYGRLKNPRQLVWFPQLGTVDLELEVFSEEDKKPLIRSFSVSPLLATLVLHFEDRPEWTSHALSNETGLSEHVILKRMAYWVGQRVVHILRNEKGVVTYQLGNSGSHTVTAHLGSSEEDDFGGTVSATAPNEEEMEVYESYVVGMLTNLGQLSLQRIHTMLQTFVTGSDVRYDKTAAQLSVFLKRLVKQEKLECGPDGMYKLYKN